MKKIISLVLALLIIVSTFCGCSSTPRKLPLRMNLNHLMSPQDILAQVKEIDFYAKMDIKDSYTKKVEVDDENDTSIVYYYDGDTLVYSDYIGYGEDIFKLHLTDEDGSTKTISYQDDDDKRCSVTISYEGKDGLNYFVWIDTLNKQNAYGADTIKISTSDSNSPIPLGADYYFNCKNETLTLTSATYKNIRGQYCTCDFENIGPFGPIEVDKKVLYSKFHGKLNIAGDKNLIKEIHNIPGTVEVVLKRSYKDSYMYKIIDGVEHRYIKSTIVVVFEDEKSRDDFAAKHPTDLDDPYYWFTDDNEYYVWEGEAVLELLPELMEKGLFDSTTDLVYTEYDEGPVGLRVKIDQNGGIADYYNDELIRFD